MQLKTQLFIDGKWIDGQSTIAVTDPSDDSVIANVAVASDAQCTTARLHAGSWIAIERR